MTGPHLSTQLYRLLHKLKQSILDETATVPDLIEGLTTAERMADDLDHRRAFVDPHLGGKVR